MKQQLIILVASTLYIIGLALFIANNASSEPALDKKANIERNKIAGHISPVFTCCSYG